MIESQSGREEILEKIEKMITENTRRMSVDYAIKTHCKKHT